MRLYTRKKGQRGLTLTELAIVLGGMGLVMGAVWAIASTVWESYRYNKMNEQVMEVVQNVREHFGPKGKLTFTDDTDITDSIDHDDYRLIPITMRADQGVAATKNINHALSATAAGSFGVRQVSARVFRLELRAMKQADCIKMLMQFPVTMPELGVVRIETNGANIKTVNTGDLSTMADFPLSAVTAGIMCNAANATNEVKYDFKLFP